jgi:hypothetical protein
LNVLAEPPASIPISEGVGIFVGIVAWDVLSAGEMELLKALLISAGGTAVWYGARCWQCSRRKRR